MNNPTNDSAIELHRLINYHDLLDIRKPAKTPRKLEEPEPLKKLRSLIGSALKFGGILAMTNAIGKFL